MKSACVGKAVRVCVCKMCTKQENSRGREGRGNLSLKQEEGRLGERHVGR